MRPQRFRNRTDAGRQLAEKLAAYADRPDVLVLALPRGGVPVGFEVARALGAPLDVFLVRKLGVPGYEELAMGAVASGGGRILNDEIVHGLGISEHEIDAAVARELQELARREQLFRGDLGVVGMFERRQRLGVERPKVLRERAERRGADDAEQEWDQNWACWHCVTLCADNASMEGLQRPDRNWSILSRMRWLGFTRRCSRRFLAAA